MARWLRVLSVRWSGVAGGGAGGSSRDTDAMDGGWFGAGGWGGGGVSATPAGLAWGPMLTAAAFSYFASQISRKSLPASNYSN